MKIRKHTCTGVYSEKFMAELTCKKETLVSMYNNESISILSIHLSLNVKNNLLLELLKYFSFCRVFFEVGNFFPKMIFTIIFRDLAALVLQSDN